MTDKQKDILTLAALAVLYVPAVFLALERPWPQWVPLLLGFTASVIWIVNRLADLESAYRPLDGRRIAGPDSLVYRATGCSKHGHVWLLTGTSEGMEPSPAERCSCGRYRYEQGELILNEIAGGA